MWGEGGVCGVRGWCVPGEEMGGVCGESDVDEKIKAQIDCLNLQQLPIRRTPILTHLPTPSHHTHTYTHVS